MALKGPYSGCFVDSGCGCVGGEEETPRINKPFSHIAERRVLVLGLRGRLDENVFPSLNGRKLKKSAYDELQEYYQGLISGGHRERP